jgi:putative selenate reductase
MDAARAAVRVAGVAHVRLVYRRDVRNMPADAEELQLAKADGVEFCELLAPVAFENQELRCEVMRLGEPDAGGRRSPEATGAFVTLTCTALVAAVGEGVETDIFARNGLALTERGRVRTDANCRTNRENIFVIGDARRGPATVVEGIADARAAADAIIGAHIYTIPDILCDDCAHKKQGVLRDFGCPCGREESTRCLNCGTVCECCVQVCPNRANLSIPVGEGQQIVHIDKLCNECGNCLVFCPYDSAPYKEKWTLFSTEDELDDSENQGFFHKGERKFKVRFCGELREIELGKDAFHPTLTALMETILREHGYLLRA